MSAAQIEPRAMAIVARGKYMLAHCRIEEVHADLGARGFATVRFFGASGTPLKRPGFPNLMPDGVMPPMDMLPIEALAAVSA